MLQKIMKYFSPEQRLLRNLKKSWNLANVCKYTVLPTYIQEMISAVEDAENHATWYCVPDPQNREEVYKYLCWRAGRSAWSSDDLSYLEKLYSAGK